MEYLALCELMSKIHAITLYMQLFDLVRTIVIYYKTLIHHTQTDSHRHLLLIINKKYGNHISKSCVIRISNCTCFHLCFPITNNAVLATTLIISQFSTTYGDTIDGQSNITSRFAFRDQMASSRIRIECKRAIARVKAKGEENFVKRRRAALSLYGGGLKVLSCICDVTELKPT